MKKFKIYLITSIFIISTILPLTSCADKKTTSSENVSTTSKSSNDGIENLNKDDKDNSKTSSNTESKNNNSTSTNNSTAANNSITQTENKLNNKIPYPVFNNINNQDKVNKLVLDYVKKIDNLYNTGDGTSLDIKYKTTYKNSKYISIYFYGDIKDSNAAHPSKYKSTLNINIEKASTMTLSDIAKVNDKFISGANKGVESEFKKLGTEALDKYKGNNLKSLLDKSDKNTEYISEVQSYFSDSEVVVILSVPHAIGDYMEIHISNSSIENNIIKK